MYVHFEHIVLGEFNAIVASWFYTKAATKPLTFSA